jgi:hypothetical protein
MSSYIKVAGHIRALIYEPRSQVVAGVGRWCSRYPPHEVCQILFGELVMPVHESRHECLVVNEKKVENQPLEFIVSLSWS